MGKYVESNLNNKETIVLKAKLNPLKLVLSWLGTAIWCGLVIFGKAKVTGLLGDIDTGSTLGYILLGFTALLMLPALFKSVKTTLNFIFSDLAITDKRVIGKTGIIASQSLDAPLNKVQNANVSKGLLGGIFGYGAIKIQTAGDAVIFHSILKPDEYKKALMNQIEVYEEEKIKEQAAQMAAAIKPNAN